MLIFRKRGYCKIDLRFEFFEQRSTLRHDYQTVSKFEWTIAVQALAEYPFSNYVELPLNRFWTKAVVGDLGLLLMLSFLGEDTERAMDVLSRLKNSQSINLASEDHSDEYKIWSYRQTPSEVSRLSFDTRYFGCPKEFNPLYLCFNNGADLGSLYAHHLYTAFISGLVEVVTDVGGTTKVCDTNSTDRINIIFETRYDEWSRLRLRNMNIDSFAISYHESHLGAIEQVYCTINLVLRNRGIITDFIQDIGK